MIKKSNRDCSVWWYIRQIPQLYNWGIYFSSCKLHYWQFPDQPLYGNYSLPREIYYSSLCLFLGQTSIMTGHFESTKAQIKSQFETSLKSCFSFRARHQYSEGSIATVSQFEFYLYSQDHISINLQKSEAWKFFSYLEEWHWSSVSPVLFPWQGDPRLSISSKVPSGLKVPS